MPETGRPTKPRDTQMAKGKHKNPTNKNQGYVATSEPSSPTTPSSRYSNKPEKQEMDLKLHLMMLIEDFEKDINNSLKEMQENIGQQVKAQQSLNEIKGNMEQKVETLKEETQKSLKEICKNMGE